MMTINLLNLMEATGVTDGIDYSDKTGLNGLDDKKMLILEELNKIRTDPKSYLPLLEELMDCMTEGNKNDLGKEDQKRINYVEIERKKVGKVKFWINEGPGVIPETIEFLKNQEAVGAMIPHPVTMRVAQDHADDPASRYGHASSEDRPKGSRYLRYCTLNSGAGESISPHNQTPEDTVLGLLIDSGVADRGHRFGLFVKGDKYCGIGLGTKKGTKPEKLNTDVVVINCASALRFSGGADWFFGLRSHANKEKDRAIGRKILREANEIFAAWKPYSELTSLAELFEVSKNLDVLDNDPSKTYVKEIMKLLPKDMELDLQVLPRAFYEWCKFDRDTLSKMKNSKDISLLLDRLKEVKNNEEERKE